MSAATPRPSPRRRAPPPPEPPARCIVRPLAAQLQPDPPLDSFDAQPASSAPTTSTTTTAVPHHAAATHNQSSSAGGRDLLGRKLVEFQQETDRELLAVDQKHVRMSNDQTFYERYYQRSPRSTNNAHQATATGGTVQTTPRKPIGAGSGSMGKASGSTSSVCLKSSLFSPRIVAAPASSSLSPMTPPTATTNKTAATGGGGASEDNNPQQRQQRRRRSTITGGSAGAGEATTPPSVPGDTLTTSLSLGTSSQDATENVRRSTPVDEDWYRRPGVPKDIFDCIAGLRSRRDCALAFVADVHYHASCHILDHEKHVPFCFTADKVVEEAFGSADAVKDLFERKPFEHAVVITDPDTNEPCMPDAKPSDLAYGFLPTSNAHLHRVGKQLEASVNSLFATMENDALDAFDEKVVASAQQGVAVPPSPSAAS